MGGGSMEVGGLVASSSTRRASELPSAKFTESLDQAEVLFKNFDRLSPEDKTALIDHLGNAYTELLKLTPAQALSQLPAELEASAARMFYLFGKCLYGGDMEASRQMFQLSLAIQLASCLDKNLLPNLKSCDRLDQVPQFLTNAQATFQHLDHFLLTSQRAVLAEMVSAQEPNKAFDIAASLRWLGATYQNLDAFKGKEHIERFETVYGLARDIWTKIDTLDSRWEVAQIIYNTHRFLHYSRNPGDVLGALKTLNALDPYLVGENDSLRSFELRAQVMNIMSVEMANMPVPPAFAATILQQRFGFVSKAVEMAESRPGFNTFLKTMFLNNQAGCALQCLSFGLPVVTPDTIERSIQKVMAEIKARDYDHYYYAIFAVTAAKFAMHTKKADEALGYLDLADQVSKKYPESTASIVATVQQLRPQAQLLKTTELLANVALV